MGNKLTKSNNSSLVAKDLLGEIRNLIEETRSAVATTVNVGLTALYWRIGKRINEEILEGKRAEYGEEIVSTLWRQLSWSHFKEIIYLKDRLQHEFYAAMCRAESWSVRTLRKKINSMFYERTAISKKPEELAKKELAELREEDRMSPDLVFRDPYVLDFLNLKDTFSERDLEAAILSELESFLLELGVGFTFVARQKRMVIDNEDHYLDLLFFHRKLRRLAAIELKLGRFKAAYKGQMELYLRWLEKHGIEEGETSPLGLILCAEGSHEQIELLELDKTSIHVAQYLTELPPKEVLQRKLRSAIEAARAQLEQRDEESA